LHFRLDKWFKATIINIFSKEYSYEMFLAIEIFILIYIEYIILYKKPFCNNPSSTCGLCN